ncbi:MAG: tetratricopeptide repeat protein [Candidatus Obscuribacter sp.]|nr:tetratricopeptide repeat protein [Candidatus Obscuribacter sp.]MBP6351384.1 tetratricopeptide repeat protein [Candidatus Obscuribacter sp.]MBP6591935.1 tetratricopeptide repeat protein [Candidatus Obscuribacter sp.]
MSLLKPISLVVAFYLTLGSLAPAQALDLLKGKNNTQKQVEKSEKQVEMLLSQGSPEALRQALNLIEQGAANQCDSAKLHLYQGRIYERSGDDDKAIMSYIECLILLNATSLTPQPDTLQAREALGGLYMKRGSFDEAGGQLRKVLELAPGDIRARGNLGICMIQLGFYKQAVDEFKKVLSSDAKNFTALYNLGLALSAQNEPGLAASYFQQAIALGESTHEQLLPMALIGLANCYREQNQYASALRLVQRAKNLAPRSHYAYLAEAQIFEKTKQPGKAIEAVKKAIELNPQDQNCKLALGRILERGTAFNAGNAKSGGSGSIAAKAAKNPI